MTFYYLYIPVVFTTVLWIEKFNKVKTRCILDYIHTNKTHKIIKKNNIHFFDNTQFLKFYYINLKATYIFVSVNIKSV